MSFLTIFFIAVGLAMDAFAVSIASGVILRKNKVKQALVIGVMFGTFQMIMPVIGWMVGRAFWNVIAPVDHWVAFGLLMIIGIKMIWEATVLEEAERVEADMSFVTLLGLATATSIDALAVGLGFAFLDVAIVFPVIVIGAVTFVMSFAGTFLGARLGSFLEQKVEVAGGIVLILIGLQILVQHLAH